jgi:hypothetical protein
MIRVGRDAASGAVLAVAGSMLLFSSLFLGWYQFTNNTNGAPSTVTYFPGSSANVQCTAGAGCNYAASGTQSYQTLHLASTGVLYAEIQFLVATTALLGLLATVLVLWWWGHPARRRAMLVLAGLAGAFGGFAPVLLWVDSPVVTRTDASSPPFPGPWSSFSGSVVHGTTSWSWGPQDGWYVAVVGALILLGGAFYWAWATRRPEPSPAESPGADEPAGRGPETTTSPPTQDPD